MRDDFRPKPPLPPIASSIGKLRLEPDTVVAHVEQERIVEIGRR
jgi:hypothetical protein